MKSFKDFITESSHEMRKLNADVNTDDVYKVEYVMAGKEEDLNEYLKAEAKVKCETYEKDDSKLLVNGIINAGQMAEYMDKVDADESIDNKSVVLQAYNDPKMRMEGMDNIDKNMFELAKK